MSQRLSQCEAFLVAVMLTFSFGVFADEGELSGDEIDEIFDDVNHGSGSSGESQDSSETHTASIPPSRSDFNDSMPSGDAGPRESVDDDEDAAAEISNSVGDSLTESNSFQSYTPEPEVTADQFIRGAASDTRDTFGGSSDPGSFNYKAPVKKKKSKLTKSKAKAKKKISKRSSKGKKVSKSSKSRPSKKSRKLASRSRKGA